MDISRNVSGAVSYTTKGGWVVWFAKVENVIVKNDDQNVIVLINNAPHTFPVAGLTINGVASPTDPKDAAELVATEVFTAVTP